LPRNFAGNFNQYLKVFAVKGRKGKVKLQRLDELWQILFEYKEALLRRASLSFQNGELFVLFLMTILS
jgi:hypothetical protein